MRGGPRRPPGNGQDVDQVMPELPDFGELIGRLRSAGPLAPLLLAAAVVLLWLASGLYVVGPGERGVVRRFGREVAKTGPGLNWHWPWPVERADVVNIERVQRIELGFRSVFGPRRATAAATRRVPAEALMLTGDENIVDAQMIVQYRISDPSKYLFRLKDPEGSLHAAAEVALRSEVGNTTIDEVLTVGRLKVQDATHKFLQRLMDTYQSGLLVTAVKLQTVDPPDEVKDAFHEVVRAREDKEKLINKAEAYREDLLPKARGEAQKILRAAEAFREERVLHAQGEAARFTALAEAYRQAPAVTRERLHLETIERVLAGSKKVLVDTEVGRGVLPLLPLLGAGEGPGRPEEGRR